MNPALIAITLASTLPLLLSAVVAGPPPEKAEVVVIRGGTVIDCLGRVPIPDAVVLIEGGMIRAVGNKDEVRVPRGARLIDASGKFIMPGLIDMHVHYREWRGALFLAGGGTTVKDLGNPMEWISHLSHFQKEGKLRGTSIFDVGDNIDSPLTDTDHAIRVADHL